MVTVMNFRDAVNRFWRLSVVALFAVSIGIPLLQPKPAKAAAHSMQTGYYVGSGAAKTISGVGFQPQLVIIKASNSALVASFKSSAMPASALSNFGATADVASTALTFTSTGFTMTNLGAINTVNIHYTWTAFAGSDCSASGTMCVGAYTGDGATTKSINTGFQPSIVIGKRSTAVAAHFRTASMAANRTDFFTSTAADTTGTYIQNFSSSGFTVGSTDNASGGAYYYIAFKTASGLVSEGTYAGDGTDNRSITGLGMQPTLVLVKNSTSATVNNRRAVMTTPQNYGDSSSYVGDAVVNASNFIQQLQSDGFQVGSGVNVNETSTTNYWFAIGGGATQPSAAGSFSMATGSYSGTGVAQSITSLSFAPDVVIVKDAAANYAVFRTSLMYGDTTSYLAAASANFSGGISAMLSNGFSVGTNAVVNTSGSTYQWQAFGGAYDPETGSGAADFAIGSYIGTAVDSKQIAAVPYQMDMVAVKGNSTVAGAMRTSAQTGDLSGFFAATAEAANTVQALNATGFEVGTNVVNNSAVAYNWFGFKAGSNFSVGSYTGSGVADRAVTTTAANQPNLVWVKQTGAVAAVNRSSSLAGDASQYFANTANVTGRIKTLASTGFTVGTATEVNTSAATYRYMAWRIPPPGTLSADIVTAAGVSVPTPNFTMNTTAYPYDCAVASGNMGTDSQRLRISNMTSNATWSLSIAATGGATTLWSNGGNTQSYDYNDTAGCSDGPDNDTKAGKLQILPSAASLNAQSGCNTSNVSLGSNQTFSEGSVDAITLASAASAANTGCYWDLTNVELRQTIPASQPTGSYNIDLTITATAS